MFWALGRVRGGECWGKGELGQGRVKGRKYWGKRERERELGQKKFGYRGLEEILLPHQLSKLKDNNCQNTATLVGPRQ